MGVGEKSLQEEINDIGATLNEMSLRFTRMMVIDKTEPTKEELSLQKKLDDQFKLLNRLNTNLKKNNNVGRINESQWQEKWAEIVKSKSSIGDIVTKLNT